MREQAENHLKEDMSLFFETTGIPVCCFQGKNLIRKNSHPVQDFNLPLLLFDGLPDTLPDVWYSYTPEYLYFGGLRLRKTDRILLIGPSMLFECTRKQAENVCRQLGRKSTDLTAIQNYFTQIGPHTAASLQAGLKLLCRLSGQNIPEEIPLLSFSWRVPYSLDLTPLPDPENPEDENREKVLLSCVTSGNLYALNRLINKHMLNAATVRQLPLTAMRSFILEPTWWPPERPCLQGQLRYRKRYQWTISGTDSPVQRCGRALPPLLPVFSGLHGTGIQAPRTAFRFARCSICPAVYPLPSGRKNNAA